MDKKQIIENYIKKSERTEFILFLISGFITFISCDVLHKVFAENTNIVINLVLLFSPVIVFTITFLTVIVIYAKHIKKQKNKTVEYIGNNFYKIENKYYTNMWNIEKQVSCNEIISLNEKIIVNEKYFLKTKTSAEITKEQYVELLKVSSLKELPLLVLTEEEYNEFTSKKRIKSFSLC